LWEKTVADYTLPCRDRNEYSREEYSAEEFPNFLRADSRSMGVAPRSRVPQVRAAVFAAITWEATPSTSEDLAL
jgi:hypothetical protein